MKQWIEICTLEDIPKLGARVIKTWHGVISLFLKAEPALEAIPA